MSQSLSSKPGWCCSMSRKPVFQIGAAFGAYSPLPSGPKFWLTRARSAGVQPRVDSSVPVWSDFTNLVATLAFIRPELSVTETPMTCRVPSTPTCGESHQKESVNPSPSVSVRMRETFQRAVSGRNSSMGVSPGKFAESVESKYSPRLPSPSRSSRS